MPEPESAISLGDLLQRLRDQELLDEAGLERIAGHLSQTRPAPGNPWYVRVLVAVGAWIAAICLLVFLALAKIIDIMALEARPLLSCGIFLVAGATALHSLRRHVFAAQLALAFSMAGHALVLVGAAKLTDDSMGPAFAAAGLCAVLYPLYRESLHRFLSCLLATSAAAGWLVAADLHHGLHGLVLVESIWAGMFFLAPRIEPSLRPLAYALVVSVPLHLLLIVADGAQLGTPQWPSSLTLALGLVALYRWIAGDTAKLRREPFVAAIVCTAALAVLSTPGVLAAIGLLVLGYARDDRPLLGLGLAFLPLFLALYYYDLDVSLLQKSGVLLASGAVLLAARWYLSRRSWAREGTP